MRLMALYSCTRLTLGGHLVNLLPVVKRTSLMPSNTLAEGVVGSNLRINRIVGLVPQQYLNIGV